MSYYCKELLKLCGFEDEEINEQKQRIDKAFQKLELVSETMDEAADWVRQNHDVQLLGVRKLLRIWINELIDLVLAKDEGKKVVYFGFPTIAGPASAIAASSNEIHCVCPDAVLCHTMGQIFNKLTPILEAGEQNGLPAGHALCSLQQTRVGGMAMGILPVPDLVLTSSYYCDMGSKADELLHEIYGHSAIYIDGSMDSRWGEFPGFLPERIEYLAGQIDKALDGVKDILSIEVTTKARHEGASRTRTCFDALHQLVKLVENADPQPIRRATVELARHLVTSSASKRLIIDLPKALTILNKEVRERISRGIGVLGKGIPRIMIFIGHYSDPSITGMIENSGLSIPITLGDLLHTKARKPIPIISGEMLAEVEMGRGVFHGTYGLIKRAAEAVKGSNVDGFIWNYLFHCRPISQTSHLMKQFVEKETGIPVLSLEFDIADNRTFSAEALRIRIETFADILRARKESANT